MPESRLNNPMDTGITRPRRALSVRRSMSGFNVFVLVDILALPAIVIALVVLVRNRDKPTRQRNL